MTRAKVNLHIHLNANYLNHLLAENIERIDDSEHYSAPDKIAVHATLKDVWLDYFNNKQYLISQLVSGDTLWINGDECLNANGQSVLKFSTKFKEKIDEMKSRHYELKSVKVNFVLYWLKEGAAQEIKIILPELYFEKST